jgi:MFS family permease
LTVPAEPAPEPATAGLPDTGGRTYTLDGGGVEEIAVVPWPIVLRRRLAHRVGIDRRTAALIVVLGGLFTVAFTITLLVVSLGTIADDLDSSVGVVTWSITGPMLAFGVVGPAFGKAGDLFGHRRVFLLGLLGAGVFAGFTALAWNGASMVTFRTLSASCGAATGPATMAYINRLYAPDERVRPLGYWSFVNAGAPVLGVVGGSFLVDAFGWRAIFAVQAPLCVVGVVVAAWLLPETQRAAGVQFDAAGSALLGVSALAGLAVISQGSSWGWATPRVLVLGAVAMVGSVAFVAVERRAAAPLLPLQWRRRRNLVVPVASQTLTNAAYMGGFLLAPRVLQRLYRLTDHEVGLVVIARPIAFAVAAPLAALVTMRVGERVSSVGGSVLVAVSMLAFAALRTDLPLAVAVIALVLSGAGLGVAAPALTSLVASAVDPADAGVAGALQQLSAQLGAVVGSTAMTAIVETTTDGAYTTAFAAGALVSVVATIVALLARPLPRPIAP